MGRPGPPLSLSCLPLLRGLQSCLICTRQRRCGGEHCWALLQKEHWGPTQLYCVNISAACVPYASLALGNCPTSGLPSWACVTDLTVPSSQGSCISLPSAPTLLSSAAPPPSVLHVHYLFPAPPSLHCFQAFIQSPWSLGSLLPLAIAFERVSHPVPSPHGWLFSKRVTLLKVTLRMSWFIIVSPSLLLRSESPVQCASELMGLLNGWAHGWMAGGQGEVKVPLPVN